MAIPSYQSIMLPLLRLAADGQEHLSRDAKERLADELGLSDADRATLKPDGQPVFYNRVGWARTYLVKAGLLESSKRGAFRITARGLDALRSDPTRIDLKFLRQYPEFVEFAAPKDVDDASTAAMDATRDAAEGTPEEVLETGYARLRAGLAADLLARVRASTPGFFERLVVELLVHMGYGGSRADAGKAIGKSGDEGIDGIIKEDRLGLDVIYVQAKRWTPERTVGRPEIQQFAGALHGQRARKGVFITTSRFSSEARDYVSRIDPRITLIDGEELAELMIDYNVGVGLARTYEVKRVDSDYFGED